MTHNSLQESSREITPLINNDKTPLVHGHKLMCVFFLKSSLNLTFCRMSYI